MRITLVAGLLALVVPACVVGPGEISGVGDGDEMTEGGEGGGGDGSGSGSGVTTTPRITATVDKTSMTSELGKTETLTLTIQSEDGFTGAVAITPAMLNGGAALTGFTITPTPASVDLTAGGSATVSLAVKVPTDPGSLAPQLKIDLGGTAPTSVTSDLTIANQLTVNIPAGTGTAAHSGLPTGMIRLKTGAKIVFHNSDNMQHVIHGDGGIPHENTGAGMPGTDYTVTPTGDATWYCHDHEGGGQARIVSVQ